MFRAPNAPVKRALRQTGNIVPLTIPHKGMNTRDPFAVMGIEYGISLVNVLPEAFGLRSRKGYQEWANALPGGTVPVPTILNYYPASTIISGTGPEGVLFAAKGGAIYNITIGGVGPWTAEAGVSGASDYWTWLNVQNTAGAFLCACCNEGGYAIYNGATWTTPTMGAAPGQIGNVNPANLCYVFQWKHRLWFIEKNSTRAWYLPTDQITGAATMFDFGTLFSHGGVLAALSNWTVDGGAGIDDNLVAVSSQGDVIIYKGVDPADPTSFNLIGAWYVGPLPAGRRQLLADGGEVYILSQFGVTPVSKIMASASLAELNQKHLSYNIDPTIVSIMQQSANFVGWQLLSIPREELLLVGIPIGATSLEGDYLAYKITTQAWGIQSGQEFSTIVNNGAQVFAGTVDGRVVKAYVGDQDDVRIAGGSTPIQCQIIPAYSGCGTPGQQKRFPMVRPSVLSAGTPALSIQILVDYGPPTLPYIPTLPTADAGYLWDDASSLWDTAAWGGLNVIIRKWLGTTGYGFVATPQIDFITGGDTLINAIDLWVPGVGGVM